MRLRITLDNLDDAIEQLEGLADRLMDFPYDVAVESSSHITYPMVVVEPGNGQNIVRASSRGIAFQEYGAGFYAEVGQIGDTATYPGVWSESSLGKGTFASWQGPDYAYPYNVKPSDIMQNEVKRLVKETNDKARRYFQ